MKKTGVHIRKILITGGTGFVGSHLVEELAKRGARVVVLARSLDSQSYFIRQKLDKKCLVAFGDLKDQARVRDVVSKYEVETIIHLGAQALVTTAFTNPVETFATNILGTTYVLEAARQTTTVKQIIIASSDKAYGKLDRPYLESDALRGDHPYEVSKSASDLLAQTYIKTYHLPIMITRFGNIYGPGDQNLSRIVPGMLTAVATGQKLVLRSDGSFRRDYVYVGDVVNAYLFLLERFDRVTAEAFNIGAGNVVSVFSLIKTAEKTLRRKIPFVVENTAVNEIPNQELNWEKIRSLGWRPKYTLAQGLQETWRWYKSAFAAKIG